MDRHDIGEYAAAIRVNLYRHAPNMPSYPVGIVEPVIQPLFDRIEALEAERKVVRELLADGQVGRAIHMLDER